MTPPESKYVAASRPVNRRTANKQALQAQPVNPLLQERLAASKARSRFGIPLATQLGPAHRGSLRQLAPSAQSVLGCVLAAGSAVGLLLAGIGMSLPLAAASAPLLVAGLVLIVKGRHKGLQALTADRAAPLFDEASLQALDQAMLQMGHEVPDAIALELTKIKQQIARIARQADSASTGESFRVEDRLYLIQCVRRYLPDSLQSYLRVPREQRASQALEQGQTAVSLLLAQLSLLQVELDKREARLTISSAEQLLQQQRFLEAKSRM